MTTRSPAPAEEGLGQRLTAAWLRASVRWLVRPSLHPRVPIAVQRHWNALLANGTLMPRGTRRERVEVGGIPADRVEHETASGERAVLYLHGGGYVVGSPHVQRAIPAHLARASRATVYALDYRLAREHPFPAALDDTRRAYEWLVGRGADPARVAIVGDSAGGGLALATALAARDAGTPQPGALALISPWVDLTLSGETIDSKAGDDAMLTRAWLTQCAQAYLDGASPTDPMVSPLFADLSGLPPTLIQVGTHEILLSDAERLAERAAAAGVEVELERFDGLGHAFHLHAGALRASDRAIEEVAKFLERS